MDFFYLSHILGRPVRTQGGERVARVKDLVARLEALNAKGEVSLEALPPLSGLVVDIANRDIFIPWSQIQALGPEGVQLRSARVDLRGFERREGEVLLGRDMLDKQLIDIDGRRVIRANDLQLWRNEDAVRVTAVDVSGEAIVRRLTLGRLFGTVRLPPAESEESVRPRRRAGAAKLIRWEDIEPLKAGVPDVRLRLSHERLALLNPVDIAHIADELSYHQGAEIIESLDDEIAADALQEMDDERQADIVEGMDRERAADILEEMDKDNAADLLHDLDEIHAEDLLRRMDPEDAQEVQELLAYEEDSAGGMMTSDFITVPPALTVDEAIAFMRQMEDAPDVLDYLYVVEESRPATFHTEKVQDERPKLLGIVTLRDLLLSPADRRLDELMERDYVWVGASESSQEAARMMTEYNLLALPVLDDEGILVGIITVDDAMEMLIPERLVDRLPRIFG